MKTSNDIALRIQCLAQLGQLLKERNDPEFNKVCKKAELENPWFTQRQIQFAFQQICDEYLASGKLESWLNPYRKKKWSKKNIALVLAGNIPLVGFHDILCCYVLGHDIQVKLSDKDKVLIPFVMEKLASLDKLVHSSLSYVQKIKYFDAVIATGGNRAGMYFESYFKAYPHIIRKNRNAVAVLSGKESSSELKGLARDIFQYFGLGCRNVSKLYLPAEYRLEPLLEFLHEYNEIILHHKYKNNFDYNYALFMLNKDKFYINGSILLKKDAQIASRIASLHYEYYESLESLKSLLKSHSNEIQCVSSQLDLSPVHTVHLGTCQTPALDQYADNVNTLDFLTQL